MLSKEQAQAITRCVHLLRPAWNEEGIYAALAQVRDRDPFEVALAAIRAAKDQTARTPGVIPAGPHWNELPPTAPKQPTLSRAERRARTCDNCGRLDGCTPSCPGFTPLAHATRGRCRGADQVRAELERARTDHPHTTTDHASAGRVPALGGATEETTDA